MRGHPRLRATIVVVALLLCGAPRAGAQSLEEETRRPPGTNSLTDDSDRLRGGGNDDATNSLEDDSQDLRGATPDQDGTNSLDDGSPDGGDQADPD